MAITYIANCCLCHILDKVVQCEQLTLSQNLKDMHSIDHKIQAKAKLSLHTIIIISALLLFNTASVFAQDSATIPEKSIDISPLLYGEKIPDVSLVNMENKPVQLMTLVGKKPTVLIFYRGGWCPFCNAHLADLQTVEPEVVQLGYQIIAISPDTPENQMASMDKHHLTYQLLSDSQMEGARAFGIAYKAPKNNQNIIFKFSNGSNPDLLPVPSVFVVNPKGEIEFEYINPDFKTRIKGNLLVAVLKALREE